MNIKQKKKTEEYSLFRKQMNANFTIETAYVSVLICFLIFFILMVTFSTYNESVLTANGYRILTNYNQEDQSFKMNEESIRQSASKAMVHAAVIIEQYDVFTQDYVDKVQLTYGYSLLEITRMEPPFSSVNLKHEITLSQNKNLTMKKIRIWKQLKGMLKDE